MGLITEASKRSTPTPPTSSLQPTKPVQAAKVEPPILTAPALANGSESIAIENECVVYRFSNHMGETITKIIPCSNVDSYLVQTARYNEFRKTAFMLGGAWVVMVLIKLLPLPSIFFRTFRNSTDFMSPLFLIGGLVTFLLWLFVRQVTFQIHGHSGSNIISMRVRSAKDVEPFVAEIEKRRTSSKRVPKSAVYQAAQFSLSVPSSRSTFRPTKIEPAKLKAANSGLLRLT